MKMRLIRMEEVKSYRSNIQQMSIYEFKRFLVKPKSTLPTVHQWILLRNLSKWKSIHINFENLFRSIHILKHTTQLISSLLGFLADSTELESVTTMLAMSLTMQIPGKSPWLKVSQTNAFWDVLKKKKKSLKLKNEMECFMHTSMNVFSLVLNAHLYPSFFPRVMIEKIFTMRYSMKSCQQSQTKPM